ncbi:hypothetical protein PGQ11_010600 [Apiospora arundinis]|uniref:F-box domain-containing protein n=1 Tax=Apiospora arundinis TaxID=335852 RepID=A0ABR2IAA2_9PEZI
MAHITTLPTEILLEIDNYLNYPLSIDGIALVSTCKSLWTRIGGNILYHRGAIKDRNRAREAEAGEIARMTAELMDIEEGEIVETEDVAVVEGEGPNLIVLKEHEPNTDNPDGWPTFDQVTRTFLNRAIRRCGDLGKLELIVDMYVEILPEAFRGAWHGLGEMTPIHTAIRARRLEVVHMLFAKGLAPECNDTVLGRPLMVWGPSEGEGYYWGNPQEGLQQAVRFDSTLFNVALQARAEDICLYLLKSFYQIRFDRRTSNIDLNMVALYLGYAEEYEMYFLLDGILDYVKNRLEVPLGYERVLRYLLLLVSNDGWHDLPIERFPVGYFVGDRESPLFGAEVNRSAFPNRSHILDRLLARGAGDAEMVFSEEEDPSETLNGPLTILVQQGYPWSATHILRHQIAEEKVDGGDIMEALMTREAVTYESLDFLRFVWAHGRRSLHQGELSEEESTRAVERCWSVCLGHATLPEAEPEAPDSAYSLLKAVVRPNLFHLCCAIMSYGPDIVDDLILNHGLCAHRELATDNGAVGLWYDEELFGETDFSFARTAFDVAVATWDWGMAGGSSRFIGAMTTLCRLVYHCGAPKSWSKKTVRKLIEMWRYYAIKDNYVYDEHSDEWRPREGLEEAAREVLLIDWREASDEEIVESALPVFFWEIRDAFQCGRDYVDVEKTDASLSNDEV